MNDINEKEKSLEKYLKSLKNVSVAFSAGVDSTFLLKKSKEILKDNVLAITAKSSYIANRELNEAIDFCKKENIKHIIIDCDKLQNKEFWNNPKNRCYICKKEIFKKIKEVSLENGINEVIEGSNMDDSGDYRPGLLAIKELNIKSPLQYARTL